MAVFKSFLRYYLTVEISTQRRRRQLETEQKAVNMTKIASRMLAGISVPDTPLIDRTIEYARQKCEPYLFNHVVRSWLFAARIGQLQHIEHDAEVVAVGTLLHVVGFASSTTPSTLNLPHVSS
jgi:hypothetical protein